MGAYTRKPRTMLKYPKTGPGPQGGSIGRAASNLDAAAASTPTPYEKQRLELPDDIYNTLRATLNDAIHELVFAMQHMDQGDVEETQSAITAAAGKILKVTSDYEAIRQYKFP